jgi:hypothetical protein
MIFRGPKSAKAKANKLNSALGVNAAQIPAGDGMEVDDGSGDDDEPPKPVAASSLLVAGQRARI